MRVAVIGGGISGLATAFLIQEQANDMAEPVDVTIIEADRRLGGTIQSERIDGYLCESGPVGFLNNKPKTLELLRQVGSESAVVPSRDDAQKRYLYAGGRLHLLPESPPAFLTFSLLSLKGRLRVLGEPWSRPAPAEDETIGAFARRHLGAEATAKLIDPMVTGIFAGDANNLSLASCFPVMAELEREGNGSLVRAMLRRLKKRRMLKKQGKPVPKGGMEMGGGRLTSMQGGMHAIIDALAHAFEGTVLIGRRVVAIEGADRGGPYKVYRAAEQRPIGADIVVLAVPAYAGVEILREFDASLAETLDRIPYAPVTAVNLGYSKSTVGHDLSGFGFLIPSGEGRPILGTQWVSSIYDDQAPPGYVSLRTIVGGARRPELAALDDDSVASMAHEEMRVIVNAGAEPEFVKIYRYEKGIPQYTVGHQQRLARVQEALERFPGLFVTGNAFKGIGVNDCVQNANVVAGQVIEYLQAKP